MADNGDIECGEASNYSFTLRTFKRGCELATNALAVSPSAEARTGWIALRREVEDAYLAGIYDESDRVRLLQQIDLAFLTDRSGALMASASDVEASLGLEEDPTRPGTYRLNGRRTDIGSGMSN